MKEITLQRVFRSVLGVGGREVTNKMSVAQVLDLTGDPFGWIDVSGSFSLSPLFLWQMTRGQCCQQKASSLLEEVESTA